MTLTEKTNNHTDNVKLLLIEDSVALARVYQEYLKGIGLDFLHAADGKTGLQHIEEQQPDVILLDLNLPDINGLEILEKLYQTGQPTIVIVITAHGSVDMAVEAMRLGAFDFLQKPFDAERLRVTVRNALEKQNLSNLVKTYQKNFERDKFHGFIGASLTMQAVYHIIESAASSRATVFITGESGTGKEVCAEAIHQEGGRRGAPFIALNCAAIPRDLIESEIFGHVKGAFTGASAERHGAATQADGGTLFLDEIGEMDIDLQSKLLRFVQTGSFQKVGGSKVEKVDVRFICATNRDPLEMVSKGTFREDLFYRLHVIPIHLPALRERAGDVLLIAEYFLQQFSQEENKKFIKFDSQVTDIIGRYPWPGNVREVQNVMRNIVVLHQGEIVTEEMLPSPINTYSPSSVPSSNSDVEQFASVQQHSESGSVQPLWMVEKQAIESAIKLCNGNIPRAAAKLEVSPSTIYRKRQSWGN